MIARLDGTLIERDPPHVVVDCGGVGYDVVVSNYTLAGLPADGEHVTLRIYTAASENKVALYGFGDVQERQLFDALITVKNVGPSTAIAILSGSSPRDIATLIAREDTVGLTRIKGVGKKTAELLVVELHEKCAEMMLSWDATGGLRPIALTAGAARPGKKRGSTGNALTDEVVQALVGMGWSPAEAEGAAVAVAVEPDATIEQLLRQALRGMQR
ncbi:MAG TPA: Holliday junction branch migration protein RuvA [Kofleriaceae bacterium]|jgi:Holliday junction DNA helicase RuvA